MERERALDLAVITVPPLAAALLTAGIMSQLGVGTHGTGESLRATARVAFLIWFAVFVASPLHTLVAGGWTAALLRARRRIGMAFASFHLVHVVLIVYLFQISPTQPVPDFVIVFGGIGLSLVYAMFFTSFQSIKKKMGVTAWRRLHATGLYYVSGIFIFDLLHNPFLKAPLIYYMPFTILLMSGFALRLVAWAKRRVDRAQSLATVPSLEPA